jgi:hypothetical protein
MPAGPPPMILIFIQNRRYLEYLQPGFFGEKIAD